MSEKNEPERKCYSVDFEYIRDGVWTPTYDHRCMATSEESAIRRWKGAGYGETRNFVVRACGSSKS